MRYALAIKKADGNFSAYVSALLVALALPAMAEEIASQLSAAERGDFYLGMIKVRSMRMKSISLTSFATASRINSAKYT
jgi:hypothetical protein